MVRMILAMTFVVLSGLFMTDRSEAVVIFQDNFDSHSDWSPTQPMYPLNDVSASDGGIHGETACSTCPDGSAKYRGYFLARSAWEGYRGNNSINIGPVNARGGAGKALTFWHEPIDSTHCDGGTMWCSDGALGISLPQSYNEIFMRFYIKFQPGWVWANVDSTSQKFVRISHLHEFPGVGTWTYGDSGNHFPAFIYQIGDDRYWSINGARFKMCARFQSSYKYSTIPNPTYLIAGDFEEAYAYGGTGTGGRKTFAEYIGDGNWHHMELRLKGNSGIGTQDGEWQLWIDGSSILVRRNIAWADSVYKAGCSKCLNPPRNFVGWNYVVIGGNSYNRVYPITQHIEQWYAIDDLIISTTYVGPDDTPQAPTRLRLGQ